MSLSSTLEEPVLVETPVPEIQDQQVWLRWVRVVLLAIAAVFYAIHFVHLRADFPNHSSWMDWAKYTDEGWYGDAAIRHYTLGHWNVPGDFNPAAALPVWPFLEGILFHFTGVSLVAARALTLAVFGLILLSSYALLQKWQGFRGGNSDSAGVGRQVQGVRIAPAIGVCLLAVSPFLYAFMRLAILEPLLILLTLVALLAASAVAGAELVRRHSRAAMLRWVGWSVVLGLLLPLMVLTKTTAVFLFPAVFWMLLGASGYRMRSFAPSALLSGAVGLTGWLAYYGLVVRPHYLVDYRYLFSANAYTGITLDTAKQVLQDTFTDGAWMGTTLFCLGVVSMALGVIRVVRRPLSGDPLPAVLLLWIVGYGAFLAYHDNLQPRYYMVVTVPLILLVAGFTGSALTAAIGGAKGRLLLRLVAGGTACALLIAAVAGGYYTVYFVAHPEYTFVNAVRQVRDAVLREHAAHPNHSNLVLSISGSEMSLMTGIPSICDDFGVMTLPDRVAAYKPGWFATWNDVEDDKLEALAPLFRLTRVLAVPAFDDPDRNLLILYRLDPLSTQGRGRPRRRRSLVAPRRLKTSLGEQPSPKQLVH